MLALMLDVLLYVATVLLPQIDARPAGESADFKIITRLAPDKASCNSATSHPVRFREVVQRTSSILGKCVLVRGYLFGRAIFASAANANVTHARPSNGRKERRIGLYGLASDQQRDPGPYVVIGEVQDCAKFFADENAIVLGYCHTHHGPFLITSEIRPSR